MNDYTPKRPCCICKQEFPFTSEYFEAKKRNKSGLGTRCHKCNRERGRRYAQTEHGKETNRLKQQRRRSTPEGREEDRAYARRWRHERGGNEHYKEYASNPEVKERKKKNRLEWYKRPDVQERLYHYRRWYYRNSPIAIAKRENKPAGEPRPPRPKMTEEEKRIKRTEQNRRYRLMKRDCPDFQEKRRRQGRLDQHRRRNAEGDFTLQDIERIYQEQDGRCLYCGIKVFDEYHIDHIHPIARGGSNWPENLAIACPPCNYSKGPKTVKQWRKVRGW